MQHNIKYSRSKARVAGVKREIERRKSKYSSGKIIERLKTYYYGNKYGNT